MVDLIRYAAQATPLVVVQTSDSINAGHVLRHVTGRKATRVNLAKVLDSSETLEAAVRRTIYDVGSASPLLLAVWREALSAADWAQVRDVLSSADATLVIVNPQEEVPGAFNAGELHVPFALLRATVAQIAADEAVFDTVAHCLGGLTLAEAVDVMRIAEAKYHAVTPDTVRAVRSAMTLPRRGVHLIPPGDEYYAVPQDVRLWTEREAVTLVSETLHPDARPRGMLMAGSPGTGKTSAARYVAATLQVPLFRLDIGAVQSKYVGESEAYLSGALGYIAASEPCVLLIDEVEKLFSSHDDSGVTRKMLAGLLWWLQEHSARVLTVMTTNNLDALPVELYRPGRIDIVIRLQPLTTTAECLALLRGYLDYMAPDLKYDKASSPSALWGMGEKLGVRKRPIDAGYTPAELRELVRRYLRRLETKTGGDDDV